MSQHLPPEWILLGYVTRAHGIQGALSYKLLHADSDSLHEGLEIALLSGSSLRPRAAGVAGSNPGEGWIAASAMPPCNDARFKITQVLTGDRFMLAGISDRTEAEKLGKTEIWVRRSDFQELAEDEVYLADLIGFEAVNTEGQVLGQVTGFSDNRAQHLVQINHEILVPFVKPILVKIDEDNKKIILDYHDES